MKKNYYQILSKIFLLITLINTSVNLFAQELPNASLIKAVLVYKYSQNIEWDNEATKNKYIVSVLSNDKEIIKNFEGFKGKLIKNKPVSVIILKSLEDIPKSDIIYIDVEFSDQIKDVLTKTKGNNTLLISFNALDKKSVMINMHDEGGKIKFEVNKANILSEGMHVGANLLLLGGTELDVAILYKESQHNLEKEKETVKAQQKDIEIKEKEIQIKKLEIEKQRFEIDKQHAEIIIQKEEIENQKNEIRIQTENLKKLKGDITKQQITLLEKTRLLEEQIQKIESQEIAIKKQELEMKLGRAKLDAQMFQIHDTEQKISKQKRVLLLQSAKIGLLENLNYLFAFILFLLIGLAFFIFRSYRIQKKGKRLMEEKNAQIELFTTKLEIEKELTMNSILYAQTIQNAILPQQSNISKVIDCFVIFRPKDIVAGDFFWFHHIAETDTTPERIFIGALDCTGHGVPGAFMSMIGTSLLNEIVKEKKIHCPSEILHNLNIGVINALKQGESDNNDGMDACLVLIEKSKGKETKIVFSGAKRPLLYVLPNTNSILELKGDRKSIGGAIRTIRDIKFTNQELTLPIGTLLYLTTDGYIDQNNSDRLKFSMPKLHSVISNVSELDIKTQKKEFENALDLHQGSEEQRDDITLIGLKL